MLKYEGLGILARLAKVFLVDELVVD